MGVCFLLGRDFSQRLDGYFFSRKDTVGASAKSQRAQAQRLEGWGLFSQRFLAKTPWAQAPWAHSLDSYFFSQRRRDAEMGHRGCRGWSVMIFGNSNSFIQSFGQSINQSFSHLQKLLLG
jgi:hypothetical protein